MCKRSQRRGKLKATWRRAGPTTASRPSRGGSIAALAELPVASRSVEVNSRIGGGAMPRAAIPSVAVELVPANCTPAELAASLRMVCPPVIGYISGQSFRLDLRTVLPEQDELLTSTLQSVITNSGSAP